jgi:hypothetical protein
VEGEKGTWFIGAVNGGWCTNSNLHIPLAVFLLGLCCPLATMQFALSSCDHAVRLVGACSSISSDGRRSLGVCSVGSACPPANIRNRRISRKQAPVQLGRQSSPNPLAARTPRLSRSIILTWPPPAVPAPAARAGVWRTTDVAADVPHWTAVTDGNDGVTCASIAALAVSRTNVKVIAAGCGGVRLSYLTS